MNLISPMRALLLRVLGVSRSPQHERVMHITA
jgi:hypothetical protein